jgi:nucleoside-diphosphate-sugar epimerase
MRSVLILGGTGWLGRAIARAALATGDDVTCLARGRSGSVPAGARLIESDRTDLGAYAAAAGEWDEVVELSWEPAFVDAARTALADRAAHWTLVSSVSVYRRNDEPGADESADLVNGDDPTDYAQAKVAAERTTLRTHHHRLLISRPGLIVGPGDPTDRFGYWPARLSRGGAVLRPEGAGRFVQVIDVDDLAEWVVRTGSVGTTGVINAVGEPLPFDGFLRLVGEVTGFDGELITRDDDWLREHDVRYWSGPRSLPLWLPVEDAGFAQRDNTAFRASGGSLRPVRDTLARTLADEKARGLDRPRRSGLSVSDEAELLAAV